MRIIAPMMILIMMTSTLAGCTGGDPDGGGEIDTDALNDLIDQNLQDFINNTTITVNQEIYHHNNTTVVNNYYSTNNEYNNTTNVDGEEVNNNYNDYSNVNYSFGQGNYSGDSNSMIYTIDFEFTLAELWGHNNGTEEQIDHFNNTVEYNNYSYYDYLTNSWRTLDYTISCSVYYIVGSGSSNNSSHGSSIITYWQDNDWYDQAWDDMGYNSTIRDLFVNAAYEENIRINCDQDYDPSDNSDYNGYYYDEIIYEFTIPQGFALDCSTRTYSPTLFSGGNSTGWTYINTAQLEIDGADYYCGWGIRGGNSDMQVIISYNSHLRYDQSYMLIFAYELFTVIPVE